ncbi:MAG: alpha/beta fold hydrolase [Anaerolineales bacterium]|nr:alpha/beta fold hydrolase [Anaerolineales bacterium]
MLIELLIATSAVVILIVGAAGLHGSQQVIKRHTPNTRTDPADYGLSYEKVAFQSRDGLTLRGWFIPAEKPRGSIVFCHGHAGSMDPDIEYAPAFHDSGYDVLMFDFRGHGRSEGQRVSMGYHERLDLLGAVDYLRSRGIDRVGVLGFSMGGAVAISTAPQSEAIRAVISDGGFAQLGNAIAGGMRERGWPDWVAAWVSPLIICSASLRLGSWLPKADPLRWVDKIAPRALLIIHGGLDPYVSLAEVEKLYAKAGEPKELWVVPEAGHRMVDKQCPDEYRARLLAFFDKWL